MAADEEIRKSILDKEIREMREIVNDHKIFWVTTPIETIDTEGERRKVGMALALAGTDAENRVDHKQHREPNVHDKLYKLAEWLSSGTESDIRLEIRRPDNFLFYLPEDLKTNRTNYVVSIRILHGDKFDKPLDEEIMQVLGVFEKKLKEIGSPKEHWKKHPSGA